MSYFVDCVPIMKYVREYLRSRGFNYCSMEAIEVEVLLLKDDIRVRYYTDEFGVDRIYELIFKDKEHYLMWVLRWG